MEESVFEGGDQDYDSARSWDPDKAQRQKDLAAAKKKYPRAFAEVPELLYVRSAKGCLDMAAKWNSMKHLFGPVWLKEEVAVLYSTPGVGKSALAVQIGDREPTLALSTADGQPLRGSRFCGFNHRRSYSSPAKSMSSRFELTLRTRGTKR